MADMAADERCKKTERVFPDIKAIRAINFLTPRRRRMNCMQDNPLAVRLAGGIVKDSEIHTLQLLLQFYTGDKTIRRIGIPVYQIEKPHAPPNGGLAQALRKTIPSAPHGVSGIHTPQELHLRNALIHMPDKTGVLIIGFYCK